MRLLYSWLFEDFDWEQFSKPSSAESDPVLDTITKNADNPEFKKAIEDHQKTKTDLLHQTLENNKKQSGLQFFDYNLGNIGMRQGTSQIVIFDIGYSIGGTPPGLLENKRFSKFLFENLNVNNLALIQKDSTYILYDSQVLNTIQLPPRRSNTPVNLNVDHCFVAGIIARSAKEQGLGNCNNALTVRLAVRTKNSEYKSAGILLYKIVSSINKLPLISDRERSTSEQAKQVWKRFESDSQAKQVPMDNFLNQQYVDIGSTGNYVPRTGSKTPSQADDCQVNDIAKSLGHPEGFIFNVDTNMFTTNHSNCVSNTLPRLGLTEDSLFEKLETAMHNSFSG